MISSNLMALILCICWWFSNSYLWNSRLVCLTACVDTSTYIILLAFQTKLVPNWTPNLYPVPLVVFHALVNSNFLHLSSCSGQKSCPWLSLTHYIWPIRKSCHFYLQNISRVWPFFILYCLKFTSVLLNYCSSPFLLLSLHILFSIL